MLSCVWKSKKALALGFEISTENVNPPTPKTPLLMKMSQLLLPRGSTPGHLLGTHGEWHSLGISFFPLGEGRFFSFGNDFAGSRDTPTGFVRLLLTGISLDRPKFFRAILFHFGAKFQYIMLWVFILPSREGLFVINFIPSTQGLS